MSALEDITKHENGRLVTNIDVQPPFPWTNDFEEINGFDWLGNGAAAMDVQMAGINDKLKPLFGDMNGEQKVIFQAGNSYYVYDLQGRDVLQIEAPSDLESIVSALESGSSVDSFQLRSPNSSA
ncbi:hypothetical protein F52700_2917 [Fusarium sp. NRRL 52700]|nr:hypothetical protein F52700_2917 [Fusarium sp. NRRL 52700]